MIKRSLVIAIIALLISLLLHFLGIGATTRVAVDQAVEENRDDVVELTNEFEDLAEAESEPVEPEEAPEPELAEAPPPPPEPAEPPPAPEEAEAPPEPEEIEPPTSQALVASANPQRTFAPDTGIIETGRRSVAGNTGTEDPGEPDPNAIQPNDGEKGDPSEPESAPPVTAEPVEPPPLGDPNSTEEQIVEDSAEPTDAPGEDTVEEAQEVAPERLAALPAPAATTPSIVVPTTPSTVPIIPLETESIDPETTEALTETTPDVTEPEEEVDLAAAAVVTSLRPRLRQPQTAAEPPGQPNSPQSLRDFLRDPQRVIESPLTAYRRDGVDPFLRGGGGNRGGNSFATSRGPGNSDVTNYAGRVLVHLNRTRKIAVSGRGWARVYFQINPDGSLAWVDIIDGSGSSAVDRGARAQIRAAVPFPKPPGGNTRQLTFVYRNR